MASAGQDERWQASLSAVLERSKYMFNNPLLSDVKFVFPDTESTIPAHKYVLAVSSPVFFAMFYGKMAECRDTIDIVDSDSDIFLQFLRFIYCDQADFQDVDCAIGVWYLAEKYDIPPLVRECVTFIDGNVAPPSAFDVIHCARKFNAQELETVCWEVIDYNADTIAQDDSFSDIEQEFVLSFLERSSLCVKEINLFQAVDRWATKKCDEKHMAVDGSNKRSALGNNLLRNIRFSLMSPQQFADVVLPQGILTKDEVIDEFKSFSQDYSEIPRANKSSLDFCRVSNDPLSLDLYDYMVKEFPSKIKFLTFVTSNPILLCGLQFLFDPTTATEAFWIRLSLWRQGAKIRQLIARSCDNSCYTNSLYGDKKVFFNRPISVDANTCYTIELLEASSHSPYYNVFQNKSFGFMQSQGSVSLETFRFCGGLTDEIPENCSYFGQIVAILFHGTAGSADNDEYSVPVREDDYTDNNELLEELYEEFPV